MACNFFAITVNQVSSFGGIVTDAGFVATSFDATTRLAAGAATDVVPEAATVVSVDAVGGTDVVVRRLSGNTAFALRGGLTAVVPELESSEDDDGRPTTVDGFADESFAAERDVVDRDGPGFFAPGLDVFEIGVRALDCPPKMGGFTVAGVVVFDPEFTDERDVLGPGDEVEPDSDASAESAHATPQPAKTAAPIPIATAKPPTLPTYAPAPMFRIPSTPSSN